MDKKVIVDIFQQRFEGEPVLFRSPGRVNLIGEHTDYNEGFVLPASVDKEILFAIRPNGLPIYRVYAADLQEEGSFSVNELGKSRHQWLNYLIGVVAQFYKRGLKPTGFDCVFGGNVPVGAGMSSSAALECGLAFAINQLYNYQLDMLAMVKMAQKAEHEYAGVMCGIMDQFASMGGKKDHVIRLDCKTLETQYFPLRIPNFKVVLLNTGVKHSLASSEYNTRRQECETGVEVLKKYQPHIHSLRDVTFDMLNTHRQELGELIYKRCHYVVSENKRVINACKALTQNNLVAFGKNMYESHEGLQHQYEVSCKELDFLVDFAKQRPYVLGARMMGGGFGGCTINIVQEDRLEAFLAEATEAYQAATGIELHAYATSIVDGTSSL